MQIKSYQSYITQKTLDYLIDNQGLNFYTSNMCQMSLYSSSASKQGQALAANL
jgi:hypothetical protein